MSVFQGDWQFVDDVQDATFIFGADRYVAEGVTVFSEPCKVLIGNPSRKESRGGGEGGPGYPNETILITIWADTLLDNQGNRIEPITNDKLQIGNKIYSLQSAKSVMQGEQYVCPANVLPETLNV